MFCPVCGEKLENGVNYCPKCGAKIENELVERVEEVEEKKEKKPAKCWSVFAKVSRILGIVAVATCWMPILIGLEAGVTGIVFSILGNHAIDDEAIQNRKSGLKMSIIGSVISFLTFIALYVILVIVYHEDIAQFFMELYND